MMAGAAATAARWPRSRYSALATRQPDLLVDPPGYLQLHPPVRWWWCSSGTVSGLVPAVGTPTRLAPACIGAVTVTGTRAVRRRRLRRTTDHRRTSVRRAE